MRIRRLTDSYRLRLTAGYVAVAVVFAAAWLWSLYGPLTEAALRQQTGNLTAVARSAALAAEESSGTAADTADEVVAGTDLRVTIVGSDGTVLADSSADVGTMENHADRPEIAAALEGRVGVQRRLSRTEGREELYVAVPASLAGAPVALRVSQPLAEIEAIAARSRRVGLLLLVVALVLALAIASRASALAALPIDRLSITATRMAEGDLAATVPDVPAEMQPLADALSVLASQVQARLSDLEAEQRTLRTVLDGLDDAVFLLLGTTIRYANAAADRLFHSPAGGWRGTDIAAAGLPTSLSSRLRTFAEAGEPVAEELPPDPLGRYLRVAIVPLSPADEEIRTLVVLSDTTDRMRLDAVRRDFVANASHELKTPVAGIRLLADSAATAAEDGDVDQALAFARQIGAESVRLQRLVGDLLDLSRLERAPEPGALTDVRAAVSNAVVGHRGAAARKDLALSFDESAVPGLDVFAAADPTDLAVALDNLLDNAITYTAAGSVTVSLQADDASVRIAVTDTGPGIPAEHLQRIFERFYRVDAGRSRDSGGTGLGLALVRHMVERSGGSITVDSEPGRGSVFALRFPRVR